MTPWAHSWKDLFPLSVTLLQLAGGVWVAVTWEERTSAQLLGLWPLFVLLFWYNPIISTHNFLHTPFFRFSWMNRLYAAVNSVNLGLPQILYRYHHLNHHRWENDRRGEGGKTRDHSSTFAYGKEGRQEKVISYCALGLFRPGTVESYREAVRKGEGGQFWFELVLTVTGLAGLTVLSWRWMVFYYLPIFYAGWFLAHLENYYEHYLGTPEIAHANSVSHYGRLYNYLFCNEGYHQEHHIRPQVHWTGRPVLQKQFAGKLADPVRHVASVPPLLGFLDRSNKTAFHAEKP